MSAGRDERESPAPRRAHRFAKRLQAGTVWINCALAADQSLPMGGYKQSGWGHERSWKGLEAYLNQVGTSGFSL